MADCETSGSDPTIEIPFGEFLRELLVQERALANVHALITASSQATSLVIALEPSLHRCRFGGMGGGFFRRVLSADDSKSSN
jgi:hypothetical protein